MAATFQLDYDDACLVIGVNAQPVAGCGELTGYRDSMCGLVALLANHSGDDSVDGRIACQFLNFARMIVPSTITVQYGTGTYMEARPDSEKYNTILNYRD